MVDDGGVPNLESAGIARLSPVHRMEAKRISKLERRLLGRYDTPRPLAKAICAWAIKKKTDRVLEPSCGGGIVVQEILKQLRELRAGEIPEDQVWACDIDPRALLETRDAVGTGVQLIENNFLKTTLKDYGDTTFDVVVANPPYVKLHAMDQDSRQIAKTTIVSENRLSARASLWAYFPFHAFSLISMGGRMAWIVPETILHSNYGREVFDWAKDHFGGCVAASIRERCFVTEGAKERVVVLLLSEAGSKATKGVELIEFSTVLDFSQFIEKSRRSRDAALPTLNGHAVPHLISASATGLIDAFRDSKGLVPLGTLADIRIGVVTGNNKFFILSESSRRENSLRQFHFQRVLSRFSDLGDCVALDSGKLNEEEVRTWLLCPKASSKDKSLACYLEGYPQEDIDANSTMGRRRHWQCPDLGEVPHAFLRYMGKFAPRMVLNRDEFYCTNTIHRVFFKDKVPESHWIAICLLAHSTYSQVSAEVEGRQYGSGVLKLEPSEAARLLVPYSESLVRSAREFWTKNRSKLAKGNLDFLITGVDSIVERCLPELEKSIPLEDARKLLAAARARRNSFHLSAGS